MSAPKIRDDSCWFVTSSYPTKRGVVPTFSLAGDYIIIERIGRVTRVVVIVRDQR